MASTDKPTRDLAHERYHYAQQENALQTDLGFAFNGTGHRGVDELLKTLAFAINEVPIDEWGDVHGTLSAARMIQTCAVRVKLELDEKEKQHRSLWRAVYDAQSATVREQERLQLLESRNNELCEKLELRNKVLARILEKRGPYSMDPLAHAQNVIEAMGGLAQKCLDGELEEGWDDE